jgi:hypothetical protein
MVSPAIRSLIIFEGTVTSSNISSFFRKTMKTSLTPTVISKKWRKTENGGGNPEIYVAAWLYGVNIMIYSQEYTNTNGMLVINADGHRGAIDMVHAMWTILYHGNNHYNSIRLPSNPPIPMRHIKNVQQFQSYLQQALDEYQDDLTIISTMPCSEGHPIPTITTELLCKATRQMMSYIALQILNAGGDAIPESHLKSFLSQVEEGVMQSVKEDNDVPPQGTHQDTPPSKNPASALYVAEFRATVARYRDSIFQLLQSSPVSAPLPDLTAHYDKLR